MTDGGQSTIIGAMFWSLKDEEYLEDAWGKRPKAEIRGYLSQHTWKAIRRKASSLGLRVDVNATVLTLKAVIEIMGLKQSQHAMVIGWVKRGWLKAVKSDWRNSMYITTETDLVNFLKRYQCEYDLAKIDHPYYKNLAQEVKSHFSLQEVQQKHHLLSRHVLRYIRKGLITATVMSHGQIGWYRIPKAEVEVLISFFKNYPDFQCSKCGLSMTVVRLNGQLKRECLSCNNTNTIKRTL